MNILPKLVMGAGLLILNFVLNSFELFFKNGEKAWGSQVGQRWFFKKMKIHFCMTRSYFAFYAVLIHIFQILKYKITHMFINTKIILTTNSSWREICSGSVFWQNLNVHQTCSSLYRIYLWREEHLFYRNKVNGM